MDGTPTNPYSAGYPRTNLWGPAGHIPFTQGTSNIDSLASETFPQGQMSLVEKDWSEVGTIDLTNSFSQESCEIPPPFVKEFLEKIKKQFVFCHGTKNTTEAVDLLGEAVIKTPKDFYGALTESLRKYRDSIKFSGSSLMRTYSYSNKPKRLDFPYGFKQELQNLADEQSEQPAILKDIIETAFKMCALSYGIVQKKEKFLLSACKGLSLFKNPELTVRLLCAHLENYKNTLKIVDLTKYSTESRLADDNLKTLLLCLKNLGEMEILNLEGIHLNPAHIEILLEIMNNLPKLEHVRLTKPSVSEESYRFIEKNKPENVKTHWYPTLPNKFANYY